MKAALAMNSPCRLPNFFRLLLLIPVSRNFIALDVEDASNFVAVLVIGQNASRTPSFWSSFWAHYLPAILVSLSYEILMSLHVKNARNQ